MKYKKTINFLVLMIAFLSIIAASIGLFSNSGEGQFEFTSIYGEKILIYGKGLYQHETAKLGLMARGQDAVTLFICIPLLLLSLYITNKGSLKGKLLLSGVQGYFLYTYTQFTQIAYNPLFLVYILLMTLSLYAFILIMLSFDMNELKRKFDGNFPVKTSAIYGIISALCLSILWLSDIINALINQVPISVLDHYSANPVYSMDLGLVVPTFLVAAFLTLKKKPIGYLISTIMIIKAITMWTALTAMNVAISFEGETLDISDWMMTPIFTVISILILIKIFINIKTDGVQE
ncbi:hypothetical protein KHQ81_01800 [Mycoplasmatota bacterium]|nr:hypothetical protein KHQ81_01800 [Mycoplasmatota bacterium]